MSDELHERVEALEQRVEQLESTVETSESSSSNSLLDRYDTYVIEATDGDTRPASRRLVELYKEAGVMDMKKIKQRSKRLDKLGVWEQ